MARYSDSWCPTCGAGPGQRCEAMDGFGGTHASRVTLAYSTTPREEAE